MSFLSYFFCLVFFAGGVVAAYFIPDKTLALHLKFVLVGAWGAVLGLVCTATFGCLLAALSPILWLFAVSTESAAFIIVLSCFLAWLALVFVVRPISAAKAKGIVERSIGLHMWLVVFAVVALQTVTLVRPMLAPIGTPRKPEGKCFFLMHFGESIADEFRSSAR